MLVNNSGVYDWAKIEEVTAENFRRQFDVNVLGLLLTTKAAAPHLSDGASIINISSAITRLLPADSSIYSGTKGAVDAITGVLAKEFAPRKVRVNAIQPGLVDTEGTRASGFTGSEFEQTMVDQTPLGRTGQPDDIADVAVFLASDDARWITGEKLSVSGGLS